MDNFMDKLAHKLTAAEIIRANGAAEAEELRRLQNQVKQYNEGLKEMRLLNEEAAANQRRLEEILAAGEEKIRSAQVNTGEIDRLVETGISRMQEMQLGTGQIQETLKESLNTQGEQIGDYVHKENVKVYRNVQAVIVEEAGKQNASLEKSVSVLEGKLKAVMGLSAAALLVAAAGVIFQLLLYFHVL